MVGQRQRKQRGLLWFALIALLLFCPHRAQKIEAATPIVASEYQLKADFLLKFARFIEWPTFLFSEDEPNVVLAILGEDPFGKIVDDTIAEQQAHGRKIEIRRAPRIEDLPPCHILFIGKSESERMKDILADITPHGLLIVSDVKGFEKIGGMITFHVEDRRVSFQINQHAAEQASLKVSSKMLRLASEVTRTAPTPLPQKAQL